MAECPLPKPNTRVRFPSPAPKRNPHASRGGSFLEQVTNFEKPCARNACRDEFAKQICASIAKSRLGSDSRHGLLLWHK